MDKFAVRLQYENKDKPGPTHAWQRMVVARKKAPDWIESISAFSPVKRWVLPMLALRAARGSGPGCAAFDRFRALQSGWNVRPGRGTGFSGRTRNTCLAESKSRGLARECLWQPQSQNVHLFRYRNKMTCRGEVFGDTITSCKLMILTPIKNRRTGRNTGFP